MKISELKKYAEKRYPENSYYKEVAYKQFQVGRALHVFQSDNKGIYCGFGYLYTFKDKIWAENCDENGNVIPYLETEKVMELW